jgi:hypothetical protein
MPVPCSAPSACPSAIELGCFLAVRNETFRTKTFYACLAAITLFFALLPLALTGTASFGAAREECYVKTVVRLKGLYLDVDPNWSEKDNFDDAVENHLFPAHSFNSMSTVVSLSGFGVWLFSSPHNRKHTSVNMAQDLDRTCAHNHSPSILPDLLLMHASPSFSPFAPVDHLTVGSYFALQWLENLLVRHRPLEPPGVFF